MRLCIELLERRDCPSITLNAQVLPDHQVLLTGNVQVSGQAMLNGMGTLDGELNGVVDASGGPGVAVTFSGAVNGTATTDAFGNFSFLTSNASLGTVYAAEYDLSTGAVEIASASVAVKLPMLSLAITGATANTVTLSGSVSGLDYAGQTVTLGGAVSDSIVTDANGQFSVTESLPASGTIQVAATDLWGQSSADYNVEVQTVSANATPQLGLDVLVLPGKQVQLAGVVTGANAAGANVTFSGAATGSVTADVNGFYSVTTASASLGAVQAVGVDSAKQITNIATAPIAVAAPVLTLNVVASTADTVTFSGDLADLDAADETVTISGASVGSVVTDANGKFTFTTSIANLGLVSVSTIDPWGEASNTADVDLSADAPLITNFVAIRVFGNTFEFTGDVLGANVQGLTVNFGGLPSLNTQTATVAADGTFRLNQALGAGETGVAEAQTTDASGQTSNTATAVVS